MTIYRVEIGKTVLEDVEELKGFLRYVMSREGAHRYIEAMYGEMMSLSVYHQAPLAMPTGVSREDHMTVDEFCNMLHQYVDEYHDNIQG